eukprot:7378055-Prymnesium_polylepis.1
MPPATGRQPRRRRETCSCSWSCEERAACAPRTPCGGGWRSGGSGMVCRVTGQLRWMYGAATVAVSCPASCAARSSSLGAPRADKEAKIIAGPHV